MGAEQPGLKKNPNCTAGSGDRTANKTTGSHDGRRIGIATSSSLDGEPPRHNVAGIWIASKSVGNASIVGTGPWRRLDAPLFGPDASAWDDIDVSNPSP